MICHVSKVATAMSLPTLLVLAATAVMAQAPPAANVPGATPQDRTMTCEMIAGERASIDAGIAERSLKKEKAAKVRKGLFGFAKGMATSMIPGAALIGGNSPLGSLAAQGAGQGTARLMEGSDASDATAPATPAAKGSDVEQARLDRLAAIATYRRCQA